MVGGCRSWGQSRTSKRITTCALTETTYCLWQAGQDAFQSFVQYRLRAFFRRLLTLCFQSLNSRLTTTGCGSNSREPQYVVCHGGHPPFAGCAQLLPLSGCWFRALFSAILFSIP